MTENPAPRPFLTRKRLVVAGAIVLVLIVAVAGLVFGVFEGDSTGELKVSFVRFEKSKDDKATLAVLLVTNRSERDYFIFMERSTNGMWTYSSPSGSYTGPAYCNIVPRSLLAVWCLKNLLSL